MLDVLRPRDCASRRKNVKAEDFEPFLEKFMAQAEALYAAWPLAA
jgi:type I restriction enzyme, R subunit